MKAKVIVEFILETEDLIEAKEDVEREISFPSEFWDRIESLNYFVEEQGGKKE